MLLPLITQGDVGITPLLQMSESKVARCVQLFENAMDGVARQASLSTEFSRPEYRSG